ncbi:MAG TPA: hypothetical protein VFF06_19495, partial [Polyangia bacterium]|nr:hypothetical protein [Polyangia bacterium]
IGGYLCDRYNRRLLYLISGGLTAACAFAMAAGPRSPLTFAVGATLYNLVTGFCYSTFTAMVVETIGSGGQAIGTRYAMFQSAGNLAIAYVGFVDTRFQPVERTIAADGVLNLGGVAILALIFWRLGSFGKRATGRA